MHRCAADKFVVMQYLVQLRLYDVCYCVSLKLKLLVRDSKLQVKQAKAEVLKLRLAKRDCVGFIGPASSGPATEVSDLLSLGPIDRAVISYSVTSPILSESRFSNFLRTPPTDDVQAKLMAKLMKGPLFG